jgi:hypothetical protein
LPFDFCLLPFAFFAGRKLRTESSVVSREDSHGKKNLPATRTAGYRDGMRHFKFALRDLFWLVLVALLSAGCGLFVGFWIGDARQRAVVHTENWRLKHELFVEQQRSAWAEYQLKRAGLWVEEPAAD